MLLDSEVCIFGWIPQPFTLKDVNGKAHTVSLANKKPVLIMFICNHCPYVQAIIERLVADAKTLQNNGIEVFAVMSNDYRYEPRDNPEKMLEFAKINNFSFPYLIDEDQKIATEYNAVCTPDFFGFNSNMELQYRGRLDDVKMKASSVGRNPELLTAMLEIAKSGHGPQQQMPSIGCSIKWG